MPVLTRRKTVLVRHGIRCDCCDKVDEQGANDFALSHTLGYDSPHDMARIEAAVCDRCLLQLVLDRIPGAVFKDAGGSQISREEMAGHLAAYDAEHGAAPPALK
jgi:hypothetical protein